MAGTRGVGQAGRVRRRWQAHKEWARCRDRPCSDTRAGETETSPVPSFRILSLLILEGLFGNMHVSQVLKRLLSQVQQVNLCISLPHFRRKQWHPTPVLLPGKSHGRRSLVGCSPLGCQESDTTERLHFHFSLSCTGEGNGNPLQCSCLEKPRGGGAWWAAVYGVAQSRTRLKRLSSSLTWLPLPPLSLLLPSSSFFFLPLFFIYTENNFHR